MFTTLAWLRHGEEKTRSWMWGVFETLGCRGKGEGDKLREESLASSRAMCPLLLHR